MQKLALAKNMNIPTINASNERRQTPKMTEFEPDLEK